MRFGKRNEKKRKKKEKDSIRSQVISFYAFNQFINQSMQMPMMTTLVRKKGRITLTKSTVLKSFKYFFIWGVSKSPCFKTLEVMIERQRLKNLRSGFQHFWLTNFELVMLINEEELSILLGSILHIHFDHGFHRIYLISSFFKRCLVVRSRNLHYLPITIKNMGVELQYYVICKRLELMTYGRP